MADRFTKIPPRTKASKTAHKHVLERHRRARINNSLNELKHLVLSSLHHDDPQMYEERVAERMEKAEILDLTVEFLKDNRQAVANNGIKAERLSSEYTNDPLFYHHMPAIPIFFPNEFPRMGGKYLVFPNTIHLLNTRSGIPPFLDLPLSQGSLPPVQASANEIVGNKQPINASENSASSSKSTEKAVWRPW